MTDVALMHTAQAVETGDLEVERQTSRSGHPTLRVRRSGGAWRWLHSQYDPVAEARDLVSAIEFPERSFVIVMGLGLGYHVERILDLTDAETGVFVFDPNLRLFDPSYELRRRLAGGGRRVVFYDDVDQMNADLFGLVGRARSLVPVVVEHPPSVDLEPEVYVRARKGIRDGAVTGRLHTNTRRAFGHLWLVNIAQNMPFLASDPSAHALAGMWKGRTAIVVAAGPSLDKNAPLLAAAKGRAIIIAAGSGYAAVRRHGIEPDIVAVIDPLPENLRYYQQPIPETTALLYEFKITPTVVRSFKGPRFVWAGGDPAGDWIEQRIGSRRAAYAAGTVTYSAFKLACELGASRIVCVGLDLAFSDGAMYAAGVGDEVDVSKAEQMWLPGYYGGQVPTSRTMYSFHQTMELGFAEAAEKGIEIVDATEGGAAKQFTRRLPLQAVIDELRAEPIDIHARLDAIHREHRTPTRVLRRLQRDVDRLCARMSQLQRLLAVAVARIDELKRLVHAFDLPNADKVRADLGRRVQETFRRVTEDNARILTYDDVIDYVGGSLFYLTQVEHGDPSAASEERRLELNSLFYAETLASVRVALAALTGASRELARDLKASHAG